MNGGRKSLLLIAGLAFLAAAVVASPAVAQTSRPGIQSDVTLVPVTGVAKDELVRALAAKRGDQTFSPLHHDCPGGVPHVQPIACGSTTNDQLTNPGSCQLNDQSWVDFYSFSGTSGQQVTIRLTSTVFDTFLFLLDPTPTVVATDDDGAGGTDAQIVFTLTSTGTWFIAANSLLANQFGAYTLTLQCGTVSGSCTPNATTLCVGTGGRFKVTAVWTSTTATGNGMAVTIPSASDTGLMWFFSANNIEMVVKVVSGCSFNSRYWVFAGGLTNVQVVLTVTDTQTGTVRTYTNPQGTAFAPIQDTAAFATCP